MIRFETGKARPRMMRTMIRISSFFIDDFSNGTTFRGTYFKGLFYQV
jgi:hypothetical protein